MNKQGEIDGLQRPLRQYPTEFAMPPVAHQGVSEALREAYVVEDANLPKDWRNLLDQLS